MPQAGEKVRALRMPSEEMQRGHRKRLREKFLKSGLAGFHDYEIVELLLTLGSRVKTASLRQKRR